MRIIVCLSAFAVALAGSGCGDSHRQDPADPAIQPYVPGTPRADSHDPDKDLDALLAEAKELTTEAFAEKYAVSHSTGLGYDPLTAKRFDLIQASPLALNDAERGTLQKLGFVVSERHRFPSFVYGYQNLYLEDLPLFVSADSILYAVHESYDSILEGLERVALIPALQRLMVSMRSKLASGAAGNLPAEARQDADVYLSVAASLLADEFQAPAFADPALAESLFYAASAASGTKQITLFGVKRTIDFSQFKPRGHYDAYDLRPYFRAMMWLGRIDFRILETQPNHAQSFHRRQLEGAYVLRELIDATAVKDWRSIDHTIESFVGEPDNMILPQLDDLLADLGLSDPAQLADLPDEAIVEAILAGRYGAQRIASHLMVNGLDAGTLPLSSTFLLFGQRYTLDSHVFSNVVYDRVPDKGEKRFMPDPLDVAFAALDNDQAGQMLLPELERYRYAPELASMRILADAHPPEFWHANLYNAWLDMLRSLSPGPEVADPVAAGMPAVTGTEAWNRRLLQTQLASWAELRHDTLLYVKQSYSGYGTCEYPDAYVDPYPELFARLGRFAAKGAALVGSLDLSAYPHFAEGVAEYFTTVVSVAAKLEAMAENQRTGAPHSAEHIAFINSAVSIYFGCAGDASFDGWYSKLFYANGKAVEADPIIADVHTDPNQGGDVLHVGTGLPRLIVVTAEGCNGPRAYAGIVSSYFERITTDYQRLDDKQWSAEVVPTTPADVEWVTDFVVR